MTGAGVAAFAAAALFALHPQRVESVVWIAERKDILCGLFVQVSLLLYLAWLRRPSPGRYAMVSLGIFAAHGFEADGGDASLSVCCCSIGGRWGACVEETRRPGHPREGARFALAAGGLLADLDGPVEKGGNDRAGLHRSR